MSLIANTLEAAGIPTVVMGAARDIVENVGVARFYFSDLPLGHSAGKPNDQQSQRRTLLGALALFDSAASARTTVQSSERWAENDDWKQDFMNIDRLPQETIERLQREFAEQKRIARELKSKV